MIDSSESIAVAVRMTLAPTYFDSNRALGSVGFLPPAGPLWAVSRYWRPQCPTLVRCFGRARTPFVPFPVPIYSLPVRTPLRLRKRSVKKTE